jgi:hypothetical protein
LAFRPVSIIQSSAYFGAVYLVFFQCASLTDSDGAHRNVSRRAFDGAKARVRTAPRWILRGENFVIFCGNRASNIHWLSPTPSPTRGVPGGVASQANPVPPASLLLLFRCVVVVALPARADRWAAVIDTPLLPSAAGYVLIAAGSRFAIRPARNISLA